MFILRECPFFFDITPEEDLYDHFDSNEVEHQYEDNYDTEVIDGEYSEGESNDTEPYLDEEAGEWEASDNEPEDDYDYRTIQELRNNEFINYQTGRTIFR